MPRRKWLTPTVVVTAACLLLVLTVLAISNEGAMAFVVLGSRYSEGDPQGTEGYDGQFVYQIALNPTAAAPYLDVPAYRYQRILYPLLGRLLALGQPSLIPWSLVLLNIAAIGLGTWATERLLLHFRVGRWHALIYGLYGGQLVSLRTDLNEPLSQALVQVAMLTWLWGEDKKGQRSETAGRRGDEGTRPPWRTMMTDYRLGAVVAFGLAGLAKETAFLFWAAYLLHCLVTRQWRWAMLLGLSIIPFAAYQLLLWRWLGSFGIGSGGAGATAFSLLPLGGWLSIAGVSFTAFLIISLIVVPMSIFPALAGIWLAGKSLRSGDIHPFVISLLLNSAVLLLLPASTIREPVAMMRLTVGLVSAMLLYGAYTHHRRVLRYCWLWLFSNVLLVKGVAQS